VHYITIIITNPTLSKFQKEINNIIDNINDWFRGNSLSLNFDKTYFLQFRPEDNEINKKVMTIN